jgi:hypothetical protein
MHRPVRPPHTQGGVAGRDAGRRILPRRVKYVDVVSPPDDTQFLAFDGNSQRSGRVCWKLTAQTAGEFADTIVGANETIFKNGTLRVFFPIAGKGHAVKTFTGPRKVSLRRVLLSIEATAVAASAHHLSVDRGLERVEAGDVTKFLHGVSVCHVLVRRAGGGNHVYVRLQTA